jgi:hypothetical protein
MLMGTRIKESERENKKGIDTRKILYQRAKYI